MEQHILQAPTAVTALIQRSDPEDSPVEQHLVVGWNEEGTPVIADSQTGRLRTLSDNEEVREITWAE